MKLRVVTKPLIYRFNPVVLDQDSDWTMIDACPICGGQEGLTDIASLVGNLGRSLTTAACQDCQFVFLRRRPTADWYQRFFSSDWDQSGKQRLKQSRTAPLYRSALRSGRRLAKRALRRRTPPPAIPDSNKVLKYCEEIMEPSYRVLDIGCGYGANLNEFQKEGYQVFGIEPSQHRVEYAQSIMNLPSANLGVEGLLNGGVEGTFDLAYSNHVLDHLYDPNTYFKALRRVLRPGGFGYITVPDLYSGQYFPQTVHYAPKPSIFTLESLCRLINKHGFKVIKSSAGTDIQVLFRFDDDTAAVFSEPSGGSEDFLSSVVQVFKSAFYPDSTGDEVSSSYRLLGWRLSESDEDKAVESIPLSPSRLRILLTKLCLKAPAEDGGLSLGERVFHRLVTKRPGTRFLLLELPGADEARCFNNALANSDPGILPLEFVYQSDHAPFWVK